MKNLFWLRLINISVISISLLAIFVIMSIGFSQMIIHETENEVYYLRPHANNQIILHKSKPDIPKPPPWTIDYENITSNPQPITQGKTILLELIPVLPIPINDAQKVIKDMRIWFLQRFPAPAPIETVIRGLIESYGEPRIRYDFPPDPRGWKSRSPLLVWGGSKSPKLTAPPDSYAVFGENESILAANFYGPPGGDGMTVSLEMEVWDLDLARKNLEPPELGKYDLKDGDLEF